MKFDPHNFVDRCEFMEWGDHQLLAVAATIPQEEYFRDRGISAGSLHKLLVHMMAAQWIWLCRWRGETSPHFEDENDHPTLQSLKDRWVVVHDEMKRFLAEQTTTSLLTVFSYKDTRGNPHSLPLGRFIQHMLDHGTYHRGQANTLIKLCGGQPINLSLYKYYELLGAGADD
jgi:uncharacterized damage-inducible protein DinB